MVFFLDEVAAASFAPKWDEQWPLTFPGCPLAAGKTGTAEDSTGGPDHAWFGCYAPYPNGKIVVVAFAQNTPGGGSVHALPMAKKVLEVWNRKRSIKAQ